MKTTGKNTIYNSTKIIIPKKGELSTIESSRKSVLEALESISNNDIDSIGNEIRYKNIDLKFKENKTGKINLSITKEDIDFLIDKGYFGSIKTNIAQIPLEFISDIALAFIKAGQSNQVFDMFKSIKTGGLSKDVAIALFEANSKMLPLIAFKEAEREDVLLYYLETCIKKLSDIENLNGVVCNKKLVNKILSTNNHIKYAIICKNIGEFNQKDHKEIALNIINTGGAKIFLKYIQQFRGNDKDIAVALGKHGIFTDQLQYFINRDKKEITLYLLENGIKPSLKGVTNLDTEFANKLIEKNEGEYLLNNIQYFNEYEHKTIVMNCINKKSLDRAGLYTNFGNIEEKDKELFMAILNIVPKEWRKSFIQYLARNPSEFSGLDDEIATVLIDEGCGNFVKAHQHQYQDLKLTTKLRLRLITPL